MTKPRLLLVDDDKTTLDGLVRILTRDEYPVSGVLSGYDALSLLSRKSFDIIITDLNMPGMNGLALIHEVKKRHASMIIVVITACSSLKVVEDILKTVSCDYYLIKPVDIGELKVALKDLWKGRQVIT
ncbi:MAG: Response regulator of zinc sigma-54-dependent two-component system [Candidatus Jettenia ecosi]|uniref:Response regulator of zinc sigma-54-dependent two-component system n=1 Tax=Candidatus Jettenia ecosi TaxID=2494326 RepID=A0A533Q9F0_9BACT|nr:MAG: Response regulator of zinc sigma-54-dependent two-component system [Candidatus Jettenia ecosi]